MGKTLKILVADDNIIDQKLLEIILKKAGHLVTVVHNGLEILEEISQNQFDLVFLDLNMPGLNGIETAMEIRKKDLHIPIIMISADDLKLKADNYKLLGINGCLEKPYNKAVILKIIQQNFGEDENGFVPTDPLYQESKLTFDNDHKDQLNPEFSGKHFFQTVRSFKKEFEKEIKQLKDFKSKSRYSDIIITCKSLKKTIEGLKFDHLEPILKKIITAAFEQDQQAINECIMHLESGFDQVWQRLKEANPKGE